MACQFSVGWESGLERATNLYLEMLEAGVIAKTALMFGQMNGLRRALAPGLPVSPWPNTSAMLQDGRAPVCGQHLPFRAGRFRGLCPSGGMPSAVGYQPTLASEMGQLQERITSTKRGSVTSVQAIYVPPTT